MHTAVGIGLLADSSLGENLKKVLARSRVQGPIHNKVTWKEELRCISISDSGGNRTQQAQSNLEGISTLDYLGDFIITAVIVNRSAKERGSL